MIWGVAVQCETTTRAVYQFVKEDSREERYGQYLAVVRKQLWANQIGECTSIEVFSGAFTGAFTREFAKAFARAFGEETIRLTAELPALATMKASFLVRW